MMVITTPSLTKHHLPEFHLLETRITPSENVRNLGVVFDKHLTMQQNIAAISKRAYYQIHLISKIRKHITEDAARTLVQANVTSLLDYCNSLLCGLPAASIKKLQNVQNSAARVVKQVGRFQHITPVLKDLHWLPIKYRIMYKINLITFKSLNDIGPLYIKEILTFYEPTRVLRSSNQLLLNVPNFRLSTFGGRSFYVQAPILWNDLPFELRTLNLLSIFKSKLKTHYFRLAFSDLI